MAEIEAMNTNLLSNADLSTIALQSLAVDGALLPQQAAPGPTDTVLVVLADLRQRLISSGAVKENQFPPVVDMASFISQCLNLGVLR